MMNKWESKGWEKIGQVGVNSGMMMFVDPTNVLSDMEFSALIQSSKNKSHPSSMKFSKGILGRTYLGDGNYHVYVNKDPEGRIKQMMIDFTVTYGYDDSNPVNHDINLDLEQ